MDDLWRIVQSMKQAADAAGVTIVTGDTKVVDKGKGDQIFINTSGVGIVEAPPADRAEERPSRRRGAPERRHRPSRDGGHGAARGTRVRDRRSRATARRSPTSFSRSSRAGIDVHCLRDLTRGGLASAVVEIAGSAGVRDRSRRKRDPCVRSRCAPRASFSVSIRSTWRTRADSSRSSRRRTPTARCEILRSHPLGVGRAADRQGVAGPRGHGHASNDDRHAVDHRHAQRRTAPADLLVARRGSCH